MTCIGSRPSPIQALIPSCFAVLLVCLFSAPRVASGEFRAADFLPMSGGSEFLARPASNQPAAAPRVVVLQLRNQSRIRGTLLEESDQAYVLDSPELGRLTVSKDAVLSVLAADAALGPPVAAIEPPAPGLFGTQLLAGWTKNVALGFSGKSGTTDSLDLYANFSGDFADERARWRVRAAYFYGLTESDNTKNEGSANLRRDWLRSGGPWFYWAEGRLDYNEFQAYRFRTGGFAGVGYSFSDTEELKLLTRVGAGASYEFGEVNDLVPEALASVELTWKLASNQTLEFSNTLFPDLDDVGEYRNITQAAYTVSLQRGRGLSLKVGLQNEYDSLTENEARHNELTYFGALVFNF